LLFALSFRRRLRESPPGNNADRDVVVSSFTRSGKFSPEEERVVLDLQAQLGNRWAMIATHLPGRTDNDVKNFWSSRQKRLARLLQELPPRKGDVRKSGRSPRDRLVQQVTIDRQHTPYFFGCLYDEFGSSAS
jgi:transcription factor MYB, plant